MADQQIPPASFPILISMLGTQAMAAMGQIADPNTNQKLVNLELAKHFIDTIDMLGVKTKGNLSPEEAAVLEGVGHELRMVFMAVSKKNS